MYLQQHGIKLKCEYCIHFLMCCKFVYLGTRVNKLKFIMKAQVYLVHKSFVTFSSEKKVRKCPQGITLIAR